MGAYGYCLLYIHRIVKLYLDPFLKKTSSLTDFMIARSGSNSSTATVIFWIREKQSSHHILCSTETFIIYKCQQEHQRAWFRVPFRTIHFSAFVFNCVGDTLLHFDLTICVQADNVRQEYLMNNHPWAWQKPKNRTLSCSAWEVQPRTSYRTSRSIRKDVKTKFYRSITAYLWQTLFRLARFSRAFAESIGFKLPYKLFAI